MEILLATLNFSRNILTDPLPTSSMLPSKDTIDLPSNKIIGKPNNDITMFTSILPTREYLTKQESCIQPLSHWYKIVAVFLLFTIYLIIESNENSFTAVLTLSKTYTLNLTRTERI